MWFKLIVIIGCFKTTTHASSEEKYLQTHSFNEGDKVAKFRVSNQLQRSYLLPVTETYSNDFANSNTL